MEGGLEDSDLREVNNETNIYTYQNQIIELYIQTSRNKEGNCCRRLAVPGSSDSNDQQLAGTYDGVVTQCRI